MSFDTTIQPLGLDLGSNDPDSLEPGEEGLITLSITSGLMIPIQVQPGQPLVVPDGVYRLPLTPDLARELGEKLIEESAKFPDKPKIDVATSLEGLDQAHAFERKIRAQP